MVADRESNQRHGTEEPVHQPPKSRKPSQENLEGEIFGYYVTRLSMISITFFTTDSF